MAYVTSLALCALIFGQAADAWFMFDTYPNFDKRVGQGAAGTFEGISYDNIGCVGQVCYLLVERPESWLSAKSTCRRYSGYLAEVKNNAQFSQIEQFRTKINKGLWLGGHRLNTEGKWTWQHSGDKISVPVNVYQGGRCLEHRSTKGAAVDSFVAQSCDMKLPFVCMKRKTKKMQSLPY